MIHVLTTERNKKYDLKAYDYFWKIYTRKLFF